jgi:hypothetical protein
MTTDSLQLFLNDERGDARAKDLNKSRTIRIPVHLVEREQKIARAERGLTLVPHLDQRVPVRCHLAECNAAPTEAIDHAGESSNPVDVVDGIASTELGRRR